MADPALSVHDPNGSGKRRAGGRAWFDKRRRWASSRGLVGGRTLSVSADSIDLQATLHRNGNWCRVMPPRIEPTGLEAQAGGRSTECRRETRSAASYDSASDLRHGRPMDGPPGLMCGTGFQPWTHRQDAGATWVLFGTLYGQLDIANG